MSKPIDPEIAYIVKKDWGYYTRMVENLSAYMATPKVFSATVPKIASLDKKVLVVKVTTFKALQLTARHTIESGEALECGICHELITSNKELTIDHILPKAAGGSNRIENLQLAHKRCNQLKGDKYHYPIDDKLRIDGRVIGKVKVTAPTAIKESGEL